MFLLELCEREQTDVSLARAVVAGPDDRLWRDATIGSIMASGRLSRCQVEDEVGDQGASDG
jgi:hypothetical protein